MTSRPQPFSSVDIPNDEWDTNAAQWRAAQGQHDGMGPLAYQPSDSANLDEEDALRRGQFSPSEWQGLRAQRIADAGGQARQRDAASDTDRGANGGAIDPSRTDVFVPGPDGKLQPIPGWHTTGPFDFGVWAHDIDWRGVAENLADIATNAGLFSTAVGAAASIARGTALPAGKMTAEAVRKQLRSRGAAGAGEEIHHTIALNGIPRTAENWRNHPAFLKVLPKVDHRRLHGSWGDLPRFGPVQRFIVGTTDWMKAIPSWLLVHGAQALGETQNPDGASASPPPQAIGQTF